MIQSQGFVTGSTSPPKMASGVLQKQAVNFAVSKVVGIKTGRQNFVLEVNDSLYVAIA